jgi:heterodisulfide reductase subunit D
VSLTKFQSQLNHCLHCHLCYAANWQKLDDWRPVCPSAARFGFEAFYASGRIEIARALIEGTLQEATPRLLKALYTCTGCSACVEQCHEYSGVSLDHVELFEAMKAFCVSKGWGPFSKHQEFARSIAEKHNPYNEPPETRMSWLPPPSSTGSSVVYFVGCTSSYRQQNIAKATVKILQAAQIPFAVLGPDEWCCGSPLIRTGQLDLLEELATHNIEALEKIGAKTVIFSCAGCYRTFKKDYADLGYSTPFNIQHTTQFFLDLLRTNKLKVKALSTRVTYHDPCHLGRHMRVYQQPRRILQSLQVDLQEMPRNMKDAMCCGAGGGVRAAFPDFAKWVAKNRIDEALELQPAVLASACPFCENNFIETLRDFPEIKLAVRDISELLMEALDEEQ